jgi:metacaspase-1
MLVERVALSNPTSTEEQGVIMATNKRALCVGINLFKNYPTATLQGCVNDANDMSALFQKLLGFQSADITVLPDAQATKANIMSNLKDMVDGAKAGKYSYLAFSMSSHGTQVPDLDGEEPDRADEAFCPHDLAQAGDQWDRNHIIVDDELRDLFIQLPANVLLEVYLDTCHSGTGLKAIDMLLDRKPRYLPPPSLEAFKQVEGKRSRGLLRGLLEKGIVHHILWAACRADQTSADANIAGGWHGAFTYYFCQEMYACNNSLTRPQVLTKVRADLVAGHYSQTPQLECEATKRQLKIA